MPLDPNAPFDQTVLELIEHSPVGAVPATPRHQDALRRLYASRQVYPSADHPDGHTTARSLSGRPSFVAANLDDLVAGRIEAGQLETNPALFARYLAALPATLRLRAESHRATVAVPPPHHRAKAHVAHDPVRSLFLVPGTGPHCGLPGNYLYGFLLELGPDAGATPWSVQLHDTADGVARGDAPSLAAARELLAGVVDCAPFHLEELEALGFRMV